MKSLDAYQEYDSEGGPMSKEHFHKPKGFRYTEEFIINLEQGVRQQNVAADRVGPLIELIAKQFADKPIHVQCSSATTILRHERLKDMLSLLYESEVLQHAESINARWDLSPQGSKELLAFFVETRTDVLDEPAPPEAVVSPPQPPEHRCDGCKQDTENSVQWHSVGHTHEVFLTLCTECESQQTMQQICKQLKQDRGKYTTRSKPSAGQSTQIRGNSARQQQDAEKCAAQILHELIVEGSDGHQYMPKCAACNNKEAQDLMAVQHTTLCLDCYSNYYTYSEECEGTLTEFLSSNGELTCAACKQTDQQCSRETDGGDQELLCPNCVKVWDERLSVPTGYDVCITLKLFCESKGKPTTASRDGNWVKPGDLIAYIRAVEGTAEAGGGVHWDVGRVMTVSDDGSNTKCQNYEEQAEQAEGEQSAFETWHEADGLFEAPVDELIVLTARKDESGTVVVSTTQINQYANELQQRVETAQAQRAKSALLGPSKRTRNSSNR